MKKIAKSKDILTITKDLRDVYVKQRDKAASKFEPGDPRLENLYHKIELARCNGKIDAINEVIEKMK